MALVSNTQSHTSVTVLGPSKLCVPFFQEKGEKTRVAPGTKTSCIVAKGNSEAMHGYRNGNSNLSNGKGFRSRSRYQRSNVTRSNDNHLVSLTLISLVLLISESDRSPSYLFLVFSPEFLNNSHRISTAFCMSILCRRAVMKRYRGQYTRTYRDPETP
jgi:hypothetical protein